ncbi:MAG: 16S rRNA (uracil(1498)-N(3))-methyltransferase [Bacteroidetes bacterium]|nr:MAG: 16S rRNA (uracil(1498)-N(3))-methyltransferase [Bacteroidota bacterium]
MHVFFHPNLSLSQFYLSEEESKHCIRVLRLKQGDAVFLADGLGTEAQAIIADDNPKKCLLTIEKLKKHNPQDDPLLHLVVAPTKNADRIEWFIEKATEAGIAQITFVETANSERTKINLERCNKVAISAMKQSKQWFLPKINDVVMFADYLRLFQVPVSANHLKYMAWCEHPQTETLPKVMASKMPYKHTNVTILIGPEGDFTAEEVAMAKQAQFEPVSLGNTILRTETAALYACMVVKTLTSLHN